MFGRGNLECLALVILDAPGGTVSDFVSDTLTDSAWGLVPTTHDRWAGFSRRCLERRRPTPARARERTFSYADVRQGATELLQDNARIDAIFCANDLLAIGALEAVRREFGRDVAGDIAVVGFDDIAMASWPSYHLTTVRQPMDEMVAATLDLVTALAHGEARQPGALRLEGRLMERSTTGAVA